MVPKNLFKGQQLRNRYREQVYGYGERVGEGEMYGNSNMKICTTISKIGSQWEFAIWLRNSNRGSVSTEMGGVGRGMQGSFKRERICIY